MTPLSHADAHERLADLALEPGALDRLGDPTLDPLAAHVDACDSCTREIEAWRRTQARLELARGRGDDRTDLAELARDEPVPLPQALRGTILEAVRAESDVKPAPAGDLVAVPVGLTTERTVGLTRGAGRRTREGLGRSRVLTLVAIALVVVTGAGFLVNQAMRLEQARQETAALEAVAETVDRVLRDPDHRVVDLRGADGTVRGSLSWSSRDLVVLTTALDPPPADREYRCWIERDGERWPVGKMWFAGGTAFWNGTLDEWATTSFDAGGTFGVSLEPVAGSAGNPAVLAGDLGT